jgi:hypothetical protein
MPGRILLIYRGLGEGSVYGWVTGGERRPRRA